MHPEEQHLPWNKQEPPPFVHLDTNTWPCSGPFCWQNPCSGCNSGTDLAVVLEIFAFNKSLRFTRLRRSCVNWSAVILTNHCQSYTAFLLGVHCSKWPCSFFCSCFSTLTVHLHSLFLLSKHAARMLTPWWESKQKDIK